AFRRVSLELSDPANRLESQPIAVLRVTKIWSLPSLSRTRAHEPEASTPSDATTAPVNRTARMMGCWVGLEDMAGRRDHPVAGGPISAGLTKTGGSGIVGTTG